MRNLCVLSLLWGTLAWAQAKPAAAHKPDDGHNLSPSASSVAPDAAVLTIKGFCTPPAPAPTSTQACETIVTRAEFEKLVDAIQPTMDEQSKRHFAQAYPEFLIMAREAQQRGLDKTPRFEERVNFARLQILSQELTRQIQEQAAEVPDKDIQDYYQKNVRDFETVNLERIVVPLRGEKDTASAEAMTKFAETLHARAAAGEDFVRLQKEAYDAVGIGGNSEPNPVLRDMRRRSLPLTQASVFDLKLGEISTVISDTTGHYIYKMDSKGMVPLETAKKEIWNMLRRQRTQKMIESIQQPFTTDVNHAYFGTGEGGDKD